MARVWAGVHWPSDVLGSVLWAAAMLAILAAIRPALARAVAVLAAGPSRGAASGRGERPRG
jgi:membrane-associated phospholipid phosphatase